ncbi:UvrD-helicase domain-containing protein [Amycolatopsis sp. Poz14]|uniref:UvrD-helicase domain-containing protein n=1 Tax=Amycolatopsis sp. Poz14 TaxID=1447705 RepID=UPI001EE8F51D|nr:UvrD-helicase domain-containing protein [Amycolatopsis sp. Poz14]MCG3749772.1 UvrD-helicase domain-containing protein [Amycolatopsis sp. Poz14]
MALSAHARRQVQRQATHLIAERFRDPLRRNALTGLLERTAEGWHLAVRTGDPGTADAFLIGRAGVFAVVVTDPPPDEATMREVARDAEERFAGLPGPGGQRIARSAVTLVAIVGAQSPRGPRNAGPFWVLPAAKLDQLFRRDTVHLTVRQAAKIADGLAARLRGYEWLTVSAPEKEAGSFELLSAESVADDQLIAAVERPFETWMTFLHPDQAALAARNYSGPARISGPAGTGKTVVALHRMRHVGRRSTGPLLFTTFVRTLPPVNETTFRRLAPELADRAQFISLHAWAREFLKRRGIELNTHSRLTKAAFGRAWKEHREPLERLGPNYDYWETEVQRIIKGQGIRTLEKYQSIHRARRGLRLDRGQREKVWQLYTMYEENLAANGLHDFNDLLSRASTELERQPLEEPYAAVVVDEAQDMTLTGLRLLRTIAGDGPNQLLLVGDGQQQVYPGGWRLSDAGIPIQGRGEVLKVNYRNRASILDFARRINAVDDLDGAAGVALRDADSVNEGGVVQSWTGTPAELPDALAGTVRALEIPLGETALITFSNADADQCRRFLESAGVPTRALERYVGAAEDRLHVGTVHRAKGLDFRAVLVVQLPRPAPEDPAEQEEQRELLSRQRLVAATRARDFLWWGVVQS